MAAENVGMLASHPTAARAIPHRIQTLLGPIQLALGAALPAMFEIQDSEDDDDVVFVARRYSTRPKRVANGAMASCDTLPTPSGSSLRDHPTQQSSYFRVSHKEMVPPTSPEMPKRIPVLAWNFELFLLAALPFQNQRGDSLLKDFSGDGYTTLEDLELRTFPVSGFPISEAER